MKLLDNHIKITIKAFEKIISEHYSGVLDFTIDHYPQKVIGEIALSLSDKRTVINLSLEMVEYIINNGDLVIKEFIKFIKVCPEEWTMDLSIIHSKKLYNSDREECRLTGYKCNVDRETKES